MSDVAVGIDLGTSKCCVHAFWDGEARLVTDSDGLSSLSNEIAVTTLSPEDPEPPTPASVAQAQPQPMPAADAPATAAGHVCNIACGERMDLNELVAALNRFLGTNLQPLYDYP